MDENGGAFWYGPMLIKENIDFFCSSAGKDNGASEASYLIEECAELIKELAKINRNKHDTNAIASEMADVYLSLANTIKELGIPMSAILMWIDKKYHRYGLKSYKDFGLEIDIPDEEPEVLRIKQHNITPVECRTKLTVPRSQESMDEYALLIKELRDLCTEHNCKLDIKTVEDYMSIPHMRVAIHIVLDPAASIQGIGDIIHTFFDLNVKFDGDMSSNSPDIFYMKGDN